MRRSFDDLDTPLHEVTFCVVDLETTGGSPADCAITEIGAARFRGGERLATFHTLVRPGAPIDPGVSALTGITDSVVRTAPPLAAVLPALVEFVGGAVLVGHNLRFDVAFLDAALAAGDWGPVGLRRVDTVALARRLVGDEVDDCRLGTLAAHLRLAHRPNHRALDDALATADLLHALLERAAGLGVTALDDLLALPDLAAGPHRGKLRLTAGLPRSPGVYVLRDGQGRALEVAYADDLRTSVRSLFAADRPSAPAHRLRAVQAVDHVPCRTSLEAAVVEARLARTLPLAGRDRPRPPSARYVRVGPAPDHRLSVARVARLGRVGRDDGSRHVGPLPSAAHARAVVDAAALAATLVGDAAAVARDLVDDPAGVLAVLRRHAVALRAAGHHGPAASVDAIGAAAAAPLACHRAVTALRRAGRLVLDVPGGRVELRGGWLAGAPCEGEAPPAGGPLPLELAAELGAVAAWLAEHAGAVRLVAAEGELSCALPRLHDFAADGTTAPDGGAGAGGLRCATC
ncbi:MAG TPA: exonuclease domain-containing protein [Acidimicrobiales bacterium]